MVRDRTARTAIPPRTSSHPRSAMLEGEFLIRWTIRLALLLYAVVLTGRLAALVRPELARGAEPWLRGLWLAGAAFMLAHLTAAFHFYHHWSNQHAVQDTAEQTQALLGVPFGAGIYFSYVFVALWVADALWWAAAPRSYNRLPLGCRLALHAYLFFIAFNGAVVFEAGVTRWGGIAVTLLFGGLLFAVALRRGRAVDQPVAEPATENRAAAS